MFYMRAFGYLFAEARNVGLQGSDFVSNKMNMAVHHNETAWRDRWGWTSSKTPTRPRR
ncbi:hypothetical protein Esi_0247_0006 [Ectocarpus siliculosus]|uniref:Uncharacterized protein n=1 Tax=Ectocarpus siliculosus TaxID=2880 RepID=D8LJC0_ECTSI|nr:hypothetical protein Esi_0247_0006 [Ectocarpus siliculosus]|eukprot:CBN79453.1 hypothetical protein Esi_0247_0006 [Ectocarpus siliculosus]